MGLEIERKFLLKSEDWRSEAGVGVPIVQGYLGAAETKCSVRVRLTGKQATLNIKSATLGISRLEFEYPVPPADAHQLLEQLCLKPLIEKTRYDLAYGQHHWQIDVFKGANQGLQVAEIELKHIDEAFERPPWLGAEVSEDPRYYNVCLRSHPYANW